MSRDGQVAVHLNPVQRNRANFIVHAAIDDPNGKLKWEQLWCRQLGKRRVELCCIPIFVNDMALGDELSISPTNDVERVVRRSGHRTFRVFFVGDLASGIPAELVPEVLSLGCLVEPYSERLFAIDAANAKQEEALIELLGRLEAEKKLWFEDGMKSASVRRYLKGVTRNSRD